MGLDQIGRKYDLDFEIVKAKFTKSFIGENMLDCRCLCLDNSINKKRSGT